MLATPLDRDRLSLLLADRVQQTILDESMTSGSQLPTEVELMKQYSVSRTVVREAAAILASRGLVEIRPRRGMTVRPVDANIMREPLTAILRSSKVSASQLMDVRMTLESAVARTAALSRTEEDLTRLDACVVAAEQSEEDQTEALRLDMMFHELLAEATHNPFYVVVTSPVISLLRSMYERSFGYLALQGDTVDEHRKILEAIRSGDPIRAEHAVAFHLSRVRGSIKDLMDQVKSR